jgi:tRNA A-37 threonylcarbamoyl transferase component Bud32
MGKVPVDKPPRTSSTMTTVTSNASSGKSLSHSRSGNVPVSSSTQKKMVSGDDYDHHTLATATTASATISYSTDQGDDASEMGMEVIMSSSSVDQHHHINHPHHHHHHSHVLGSSGKLGTANVVTVEPYTSHSFLAGKHTFTVDRRYSMIRTIGSGAYGVVISALDAKHGQNVAIKMVPKAFSDEIDAKRILREIKLLKHFRHDNIVSLIDMMPPNVQYLEDFNDVYLVTDLMETDLHRIIYSKQKLSIDHAQYFIYQVLRGLKYIHSCRVLHRDLKPSNLLVNSNCDLKICDFGLARGIRRDPNDPIDSGNSGSDSTTDPMLLTEYVVTRWYRAPEIMLACHEYSYPIDMWSVGCIFAELILRKPYFPGDDYIDQVCPKKLYKSVFYFFVEIIAFDVFFFSLYLIISLYLELTFTHSCIAVDYNNRQAWKTSRNRSRFCHIRKGETIYDETTQQDPGPSFIAVPRCTTGCIGCDAEDVRDTSR